MYNIQHLLTECHGYKQYCIKKNPAMFNFIHISNEQFKYCQFSSVQNSFQKIMISVFPKQKGMNRKQSTRRQHLSWLKASAFFSFQILLVVMKHSNLYLGLVLPSGGWQSLIEFETAIFRNLSYLVFIHVGLHYSIRDVYTQGIDYVVSNLILI